MIPTFPGSTAVSRLDVYDWPTADGLHGGTPHLHTVSTEGYVVIGGHGELHALDVTGPSRHRLEVGTVLWFTPGTVHRLVNEDSLEILTVMQNSGLPEAGDAVLTFPRDILGDPERYADAVTLTGADDEQRGLSARARRDLALEGHDELLADVSDRGPDALREVHALAAALVRPRVSDWQRLWTETVLATASRTRDQLGALAVGRSDYLGDAGVVIAEPRPARAFGMCGRLTVWDPVAS